MKNDSHRLRLLKVLDCLKLKSDAEHPISAVEIAEELGKYGISVERKAIYKDIEALQSAGFQIEVTGKPKRGYYLSVREFELPEVSLLIDAVQSAGFVPKDRSRSLVKKLQNLVSVYEAEELKNRICIENRSKSANESVYNTIELLNGAIKSSVAVKIKYAKTVLDGTRLAAEYKDMIINPYALLWESDHYYLIGNNVKYENLIHLRVDRIAEISLTKRKARHFSEVSEYKQRFDTADYSRKVFNMFGGEMRRIDLECKVELLNQITDKFSDFIMIRHLKGEKTFRFSVDAVISEGLVGWLMQFGGDIKVLSPDDLKQRVKETAQNLINIYSE